MPAYPDVHELDTGQLATRDTRRIMVWLPEPVRAGRPVVTPEVQGRLRALGLAVEPGANHGPASLWLRLSKGASADKRGVAAALGRPLTWIGPVYRLRGDASPTGLFCPRPDVLLLRSPLKVARQVDTVIRRLGAEEDRDKSAYLGGWRYVRLAPAAQRHAIEVQASLRTSARWLDVDLEYVPFVSPWTGVPNDPLFVEQWGMVRIGAPAAWDRTTGGRHIVIAVIDRGCELDHPDLAHAFVSDGINAGDMTLDGGPVVNPMFGRLEAHGTWVAGVIAAAINNAVGLAGLAGGCGLLPVALPHGSTVEMAVAVRYATAQGARVLNISMDIGSFWFEKHVRGAIDEAIARGILVCASAGNADRSPLAFPAAYPPVLACGGSDKTDRRWSLSLPDRRIGSNYGDQLVDGSPSGVGVVAPAVDITTTDLTGVDGFAAFPSPAGDYDAGDSARAIPAAFGQTSAATAHVSATAGLLMSAYPGYAGDLIRRMIERTAEKVGGYPYADVAGYPHGTRHPEMGYGRLSVLRALDLADVMIADRFGDIGFEPSMPPGGNFWAYSDVVIRPAGDDTFDTAPEAGEIVSDVDHVVTVRVRNNGPADARNVRVDVRAVPWVGLEFSYPQDWTVVDELHVRPTPLDPPFETLAAGTSRLARFSLTAAQIQSLAGWSDMRWHPCVLAVVTADNDYAFATAGTGRGLQIWRNNLAQRNVTVIRVATRRSLVVPFVIGHSNDETTNLEIIVEAGRAAGEGDVSLLLDDHRAGFPMLMKKRRLTNATLSISSVKGGSRPSKGPRNTLQMTAPRMTAGIKASRPGFRAVALQITPPSKVSEGGTFLVSLAQRLPDGRITGGTTIVVKR